MTMAYAEGPFMGGDDYQLQIRLAGFIRRRFPANTACELARAIDCDERTARNIVGHHWPRARHLRSIVREFGRDVLDALFSEDIDAAEARAATAVREAREAYEAAKAHRRAVAGDHAARRGAVAAREGRARVARPRSGRRG